MKKLVILLITITVFFSCKSTKSTNSDNPIFIESATYQNWFGGREGSRGIKIEIKGKQNLKDCVYKNIYFSGKKTEIHTTFNDKLTEITANINTGYNVNERILSSDVKKEYKNKPPVKPKYPTLGKDEAIIEYTYKGALKTFKIILKKKKDLFFQ